MLQKFTAKSLEYSFNQKDFLLYVPQLFFIQLGPNKHKEHKKGLLWWQQLEAWNTSSASMLFSN